MRVGRLSKEIDYGEGPALTSGFMLMPEWFNDNRDFGKIGAELRTTRLSDGEIAGIMGDNWHRFYAESFAPMN